MKTIQSTLYTGDNMAGKYALNRNCWENYEKAQYSGVGEVARDMIYSAANKLYAKGFKRGKDWKTP